MTMTVRWCTLLALLMGATTAFQPTIMPRILLRTSSSPPLGLGDYDFYYTQDTYHALNGDMETRDVAIMSDGTDVSLLVAMGVATAAVVGLGVLQLPKFFNGTDDSTAATNNSMSCNVIPVESQSLPKDKTTNEKEKSVSNQEKIIAIAAEAIISNTTATEVPTLFFAADDLHREEQIAVKAFVADNREGLQSSFKRVAVLVRKARVAIKETKGEMVELEARCEEQQSKLASTTRELDLIRATLTSTEDRCEEQLSKLASTTRELDLTRAILTRTQNELVATKERKDQLERERLSFRKMGQATWDLSRKRMASALRKRQRTGELI